MTMAQISEQAKAELIAKGVSFPRKKHSHRCRQCGGAFYCYRAECVKPQRVETCECCR